MKLSDALAGVWTGSMRVVVAAVLCVLMVEQPLLAEGMIPRRPATAPTQIKGQERVLHALNRFTFGPRPGDVEAVQAMGLDKWFERQLNPASIDDSALEQRLNMFPAMRMQQAELMERYPSPQMLKQIIDNNAPLPADPMQRAIYQDQIAFYKIQRAKQEANAAAAAAANKAAGTGSDSMAAGDPNMTGGDQSMAAGGAAAAKPKVR